MEKEEQKILIGEDNPGVLFNIKMTLEYNKYKVITATNGEEAIKILSEMIDIPDLIISDIMMPKMDGYEFFKNVSRNYKLSLIPFVFLSAKASPNDVRFGKILGVDDYIIKPFKEEDLLAIIKGKISRRKQSEAIRRSFEEKTLSLFDIKKKSFISKEEEQSITLLYLDWEESRGPKLKDYYPSDKHQNSILWHQIGIQLFDAAITIFGLLAARGSEETLINITNIGKSGFIFLDTMEDSATRDRERLFMLIVIAPKISYFDSLKIKEIFYNVVRMIKKSVEWDIKEYWEEISNILSSSRFNGEKIGEVSRT